VAKREHFFEFNWFYLAGLVLALASAWINFGWTFVLVVSAVAAALIGVYYLVWRWLRDRSA
jgi:uncharacterized membrane protein